MFKFRQRVYISSSNKPGCLIINTYRFASHSKSDDGRSKREVDKWKQNDPLKITEKELAENVVKDIQFEVSDLISNEISKAIKMPMSE